MSPTSEGSRGGLPGRGVTPGVALWGLGLGSRKGPRAGLGSMRQRELQGTLAKGGAWSPGEGSEVEGGLGKESQDQVPQW